MAICGQHGAFSGSNGCPKCQDDKAMQGEARNAVLPLAPPSEVNKPPLSKSVPTISTDDKLTLKKMEVQVFEAQATARQAADAAQATAQQLDNFARTMFEKYSVDPKTHTLNLRDQIEFQLRG